MYTYDDTKYLQYLVNNNKLVLNSDEFVLIIDVLDFILN